MADDNKMITDLPAVTDVGQDSLLFLYQAGKMSNTRIRDLKYARWYAQGSPPSHVDKSTRDYWINTEQGNSISRWNGSSWVSIPFSYNHLLDKPDLGTASEKNVEDFATALQGEKADTALQEEDLPDFPDLPANIVFINDVDDLPNPSGGVHELEGNTTYIITGFIDLDNNQLGVSNHGTRILGIGAVSSIRYGGSTGAIVGGEGDISISDIKVEGSGYGFLLNKLGFHGNVIISGCEILNFESLANVDDRQMLIIRNNTIDLQSSGNNVNINVKGHVHHVQISNNIYLGATGRLALRTTNTATIDDLSVNGNIGFRLDDTSVSISRASFVGNTRIEFENSPEEEEYVLSGNTGVADWNYENNNGGA